MTETLDDYLTRLAAEANRAIYTARKLAAACAPHTIAPKLVRLAQGWANTPTAEVSFGHGVTVHCRPDGYVLCGSRPGMAGQLLSAPDAAAWLATQVGRQRAA